MDVKFFDAMQPSILERLSRMYVDDCEYQQSIKNETKLYEQLEKGCSEEQIKMIKEYQSALYATWGICESLAYRQGMRDMAEILGIRNGEE